MRKKLIELFGFGKKSPTITSVKPKFPKNKIEVSLADLRKTLRQTQGSTKKRSQDFEGAIRKVGSKIKQTSQKLRGEPVTESGVSKGKDLRDKKMGGGMMGRRFGMKQGTPKPKTNIQKIKETFAPKGLKKIDPKKQKGLANLKKARPDVVRKMGYMKKGGRAGFRDGTPPTGTKSGGTRPKPDSLFDPNNPINKRKKQFKEEAKENMK